MSSPKPWTLTLILTLVACGAIPGELHNDSGDADEGGGRQQEAEKCEWVCVQGDIETLHHLGQRAVARGGVVWVIPPPIHIHTYIHNTHTHTHIHTHTHTHTYTHTHRKVIHNSEETHGRH